MISLVLPKSTREKDWATKEKTGRWSSLREEGAGSFGICPAPSRHQTDLFLSPRPSCRVASRPAVFSRPDRGLRRQAPADLERGSGREEYHAGAEEVEGVDDGHITALKDAT